LTKRAFLFTFLRELAIGASHKGAILFVASEPGGRKLFSKENLPGRAALRHRG